MVFYFICKRLLLLQMNDNVETSTDTEDSKREVIVGDQIPVSCVWSFNVNHIFSHYHESVVL